MKLNKEYFMYIPRAHTLKVWRFGNTYAAYSRGYSICYGKTEQEARKCFFVMHIM